MVHVNSAIPCSPGSTKELNLYPKRSQFAAINKLFPDAMTTSIAYRVVSMVVSCRKQHKHQWRSTNFYMNAVWGSSSTTDQARNMSRNSIIVSRFLRWPGYKNTTRKVFGEPLMESVAKHPIFHHVPDGFGAVNVNALFFFDEAHNSSVNNAVSS